jgi:hypothetical protein
MECSMRDALIVMGNGPSLAQLKDFHWLKNFEIDTIGMNAAYRYWEKINWYPTYYSCFDHVVTNHHKKKLAEMIENQSIPIVKYFLLQKISDSQKNQVVDINGSVGTFSNNFETFGYGGGTGQCACEVGVCLGYKKLLLIGIDGNYVELINECQQREIDGTIVLEIKETPKKNPNYFIDDYQQAGDLYNLPQCHKFHVEPWNKFAAFARENHIDVVNCGGEGSKIDVFRRNALEKELEPYRL